MCLKFLWGVVREAGEAWLDDRGARIAAALAFYTALALAPLLVIALAVAGLAYGDRAARGELTDQLTALVGEPGAKAVEAVLANAKRPGTGAALAVGAAVLFVGATGVFVELQEAMNDVWKVRPKPGRPVWTFVRVRFLSFGMVLGVGFLLLVSLTLTTATEAAGRYAAGRVPGAAAAVQLANALATFALELLLFGAIFKVLPDARPTWRDVGFGAVLTAILFTLGKYLVGLYLGYAGVGSAFGAAGSVVAFLAWIYFSALILVFGAEVTRVTAERAGRRIKPAAGAEAVPRC
jgi:membrane protein